MRQPVLPIRPQPLKPGPATPGGAEPFTGQFDGSGNVLIPPDSTSGNDKYSLVFVTDDAGMYNAPTDGDGSVTSVGYQS